MKRFGTKRLLAILGLIGVAAFMLWPESLTHKAPEYKLENITIYKQPDGISCGPTSCAMVLKLYGKDVSIEDIKKVAKTTWYKSNEAEIGMTAPEYIETALKHFGVPCKLKTGDLNDLKAYIERDRPPIVLLRSSKTTWHYVAVIGYTRTGFAIADPAGYEHTMENSVFENAWNFSSDMYGAKITDPCKVCGGDGKISELPGQLGKCDNCAGTGEGSDVLVQLLNLADVTGNMLIVPTKGINKKEENNGS